MNGLWTRRNGCFPVKVALTPWCIAQFSFRLDPHCSLENCPDRGINKLRKLRPSGWLQGQQWKGLKKVREYRAKRKTVDGLRPSFSAYISRISCQAGGVEQLR